MALRLRNFDLGHPFVEVRYTNTRMAAVVSLLRLAVDINCLAVIRRIAFFL